MQDMGLYIHIPFCVRKCPYCDFYSLPATPEALDAYTAGLLTAIERWADRFPDYRAQTLYFGSGTPSLLGGRRLAAIIRRDYPDAEITCELTTGLCSFYAEQGGMIIGYEDKDA